MQRRHARDPRRGRSRSASHGVWRSDCRKRIPRSRFLEATTIADAHIHLHPDEPLARQDGKGHNRWHPDIVPTVRVARGSTVEIETIDAMDRQIKPGMTGQELLSVEMGRVHPLTGPIYVEGAEPGDLLALKVEAIQTASRGSTFIAPGFWLLREHFPPSLTSCTGRCRVASRSRATCRACASRGPRSWA